VYTGAGGSDSSSDDDDLRRGREEQEGTFLSTGLFQVVTIAVCAAFVV
jgi:hypothetical protein